MPFFYGQIVLGWCLVTPSSPNKIHNYPQLLSHMRIPSQISVFAVWAASIEDKDKYNNCLNSFLADNRPWLTKTLNIVLSYPKWSYDEIEDEIMRYSVEFFVEVADFAEEGLVLDLILIHDLSETRLELCVVPEMLGFFLFDLFENPLDGVPWMMQNVLSFLVI